MAKSETKQRISIGCPSLILIFIMMCLATFALLSLSSADGALKLAEKNANAVRDYYQADQEGERFVWAVNQGTVKPAQSSDDQNRQFFLKEIPMDFDRVLQIGIFADEEGKYRIQSWKVFNQKDYEIDNSIDVWNGDGDFINE